MIPKPCLSVRTPRKENHPSFVNMSPILVIDTSMESSSEFSIMRSQKFDFITKEDAQLSVYAVMFCKQFLSYTVHKLKIVNYMHPFEC